MTVCASPPGPLARAALVALRPRQWVKNLLLFAGIIFAAELGDPLKLGSRRSPRSSHTARRRVPRTSSTTSATSTPTGCIRSSATGRSREESSDLGSPVVLAARARSPSRSASRRGSVSRRCCPARLRRAPDRVLARAQERRARRRARHRRALRDPGRRRRGRGRRQDLALAPRLHGPSGAVPRSREASGGARRSSARSGTSGRRVLAGYSTGSRRPDARRRRGRHDRPRTCSTASRRATRTRSSSTVPFVVFGLGRYLHLVREGNSGEEPENVLLGDMPILLTVAVWAVACAAILAQT